MFWFFLIIAVAAVLLIMQKRNTSALAQHSEISEFNSTERASLFNVEFPNLYAKHSKPMLKEEFPDIAGRFTTSTCVQIGICMQEAMSKNFGVEGIAQVLMKMEDMTAEQVDRAEEEASTPFFESIPDSIREHIRENEDREERFGRASGAAMLASFSEFVKANS